jgi:hypothetical protein
VIDINHFAVLESDENLTPADYNRAKLEELGSANIS